MIEVTGIDLVKFVQKAYELSSAQGMGIYAFQPGPLSEEIAKKIVDEFKLNKGFAVSLDYVMGRSCKMHVERNGDRWFIRDNWYDHTDSQLEELLESVGIDFKSKSIEHNPCCECVDCKRKNNGAI